MFDSLPLAPPDPILGLGEAFKSDPRPGKINLSVGVYKDEQGGTPILSCVKEAERRLLEQYFPPLQGQSIFKTDLWDEAKNTEILRWAADQGARPFGADIAGEVVHGARKVLAGHRPGFAVGDVRAIPFQDGAFDLLYSMGTIEHFPDYRVAIAEIYRVLKPGGRAIIGVPNKTDPFLRPLHGEPRFERLLDQMKSEVTTMYRRAKAANDTLFDVTVPPRHGRI